MSANVDEGQLVGDPAPELVEGRIWVDGCFDFFHHGKFKFNPDSRFSTGLTHRTMR